MTGQILSYNPEALCGVVSASDGKRYDFIAAEVKSDQSEIVRGAMVDFILDEQGNMLEIYVIQATQGQTRTTAQSTYTPNHTMEYSHGESNGGGFKSLFSFRGCYTRKAYWKMLISIIVFEFLFSLMLNELFPSGGWFDFESDIKIYIAHALISIPLFWIMLATSVKRFHDINKSGAWWFFNFVPIIGNLVVFIMNGFVGSVRVGNNYCFNNNTTSYRSDTQAVNSTKATAKVPRQEERIDLEKIQDSVKTFLTNEKNSAIFMFLKKFMTNKKNIAILILLLVLYVAYYFVNAYIDEHRSIEGFQDKDYNSGAICSEVLKNTKQSDKLTHVTYDLNGRKAYSVEYKNPSYFFAQTSYFVDRVDPQDCNGADSLTQDQYMLIPADYGRRDSTSSIFISITEDGGAARNYNCTRELGVRDGIFRKWSETGALLIEASYVNGELDGDLKKWEENGTLISTTTYVRKNGALSVRIDRDNQGIKELHRWDEGESDAGMFYIRNDNGIGGTVTVFDRKSNSNKDYDIADESQIPN